MRPTCKIFIPNRHTNMPNTTYLTPYIINTQKLKRGIAGEARVATPFQVPGTRKLVKERAIVNFGLARIMIVN